ncbi:MAG: peptidylprolyl isomerase [Thermoleophilia bacterium]|mgnify:CR=1 FL=1
MSPEGPDPAQPVSAEARGTIPAAVGASPRSHRRSTRLIAGFVVLSATAVAAVGCGNASNGSNLPSGVVARVGDTDISQAQLDRLLEQAIASSTGQTMPKKGTKQYTDLARQGLAQLVQQQIVRSEVAKCGTPCQVANSAVTKELDALKKQRAGGNDKKFAKFLADHKYTMDEARKLVRLNLAQTKLQNWVTRGVRFTPAQAKTYYDQHRAQYHIAEQRTVSHILVKTRAEADSIRAQVTPANFAALAKKYSTDTGSAKQGGNLGVMSPGVFVKEFETAADALKQGEISKPVKSQFGWHIIYVTKITPAHVVSFASARSNIISQQTQQARSTSWTTWTTARLKEWNGKTVYASKDLAPQTSTTSTAATN